MKNLICLPAFLALFAFTSQSQPNPKLKVAGTITNNKKPIEAAAVALLKAKDSSVVKMGISEKDGNFEITAPTTGKYLISVQAIGYTKYLSEQFELSNNQSIYTAKNILLIAANKQLDNVTVTTKKPLIEQKIDRTVLNVEASVTNVGANALEVLEKSPGVTVDKDGNISLKGKAGVQIFIDGKPAYVSGDDLTNMLKNMQASQLDQIEIMTNPPAKYDAAGNAGIINIKTKKTKAFGFNGSATLGYTQGFYAKGNENLNLNYRENKVNIFGNISQNYRKNYQELNIDRKFIDGTTKNVTSLFSQKTDLLNDGQSYQIKGGADYFASKKTTFGIVVSGTANPQDFSSNGVINISSPTNVLDSQTIAKSLSSQHWNDFSTNFNFRQILDSTGQELTADLDYIYYNSTNTQTVTNKYLNNLGMPSATKKPDTLIGQLPQNIHIYSAKVDYSLPLKKGAKFEAGLKTSFVQTDANAIYDSIINGNTVHDNNRSNHFVYKENVNAAYVNFSKPFSKKISAQLGLRAEQTISKGNQITQNVVFDKNYIQLFPTAYLQYTVNDKNSVVLNYGRRIRRPDYQSLNPFVQFLDRYTFQQGNPQLQPQFSHNIELSHTYRGFLTTTLNYTNTTDIIQQVIEQNAGKNETYIKQENIANQRQYGISINSYNQFTKWWSGNTYVNVYNNQFSGIINNDYVNLESTTAVFNLNEQFKFKKGWSAELSGFYRTQGLEGVFNIKPLGAVNMGIGKQVLKNKGSIKLSVRDVFFTQKAKGESKYSNIDAAFRQENDSRQISIAFTYRFSKMKGKVAQVQKRKIGGADDEKSRIGSGNN